ncbi:hypothetical protein K3181_06525 [Qipengyuania sp. YG27]|uniref:Uncharacterized protein n=1 Tax=Qipengyuania mesophila TaxID=2867246 RepID=A0ABS7JTW3_9SPHN|nr:hypothetical protein [Qipengyuania mesophila]MBX7501091.1 hypothetical protein [Qipengyuania mesophila]
MTALERVTQRAMRHGDPERPSVPSPLLSLEEFFDGNDEIGSIGCNLESEPEPAEFFELFMDIRSRSEVSDVRIQITSVEAPGVAWPFSDTVWIMTEVGEDEVRNWFPEHLAPDEVWEGFIPNAKYEECAIAEGHKPVAVWYD